MTEDHPLRVLLATIRNLGNCPCPRCLVPKCDIYKVGTAVDREHRKTKARTDDEARQRRVDLARGFVYGEQRLPVNGVAVENQLKERSEVPTRVSDHRTQSLAWDPDVEVLECVLSSSWPPRVRFSLYAC